VHHEHRQTDRQRRHQLKYKIIYKSEAAVVTTSSREIDHGRRVN
jgi:hypothetical protein